MTSGFKCLQENASSSCLVVPGKCIQASNPTCDPLSLNNNLTKHLHLTVHVVRKLWMSLAFHIVSKMSQSECFVYKERKKKKKIYAGSCVLKSRHTYMWRYRIMAFKYKAMPTQGFQRVDPSSSSRLLALSSSAFLAYIINNLTKEERRTTLQLHLIYGIDSVPKSCSRVPQHRSNSGE